jgi:peptidoglycan-associated lipoprotein
MNKRLLALATLALLGAACAANPKTVNPTTDVNDAAAAKAKADADAAAAAAAKAKADAEEAAARARADAEAAAQKCDLVKVRFGFDSSQLDGSAQASLRADAECLAKRRATALLIEGHCDERGTVQYNIALGARRAESVRKYLADLGVKTKLDTVSFGKELPVASGSDESAWAQNRRAEFRLPGEKRSDGQLVAGN